MVTWITVLTFPIFWTDTIPHFDNFMHPFTLSKYLDLPSYKKEIHAQCPDEKLVFSKFMTPVLFDDLAEFPDSRKRSI